MPSPCPTGHFSLLAGRTSRSDCSPCPPGSFCNSTALTQPSGLCSPGLIVHYHPWEIMSENSATLWECIFLTLFTHCIEPQFLPNLMVHLSFIVHFAVFFSEMSNHCVCHRTFLFHGVHWASACLPALWWSLSHGTLLSTGQWVTQTVSCWHLPPRARSFLPLSLPPLPPGEILPQSWTLTAHR